MAMELDTGRDTLSGPEAVEIPCGRLAPETLDNLIEEFVSREGTDYGHRDYALADKVAQVRRQLESGEARIVYDPRTQSCHILPVKGCWSP